MTGVHLSELERHRLETLRAAFEAHHPATTDPDAEPRIPRILHQVWIGGNPLPDHFRRFRDGWMERHPDWEHRLWTDAEIDALDFEDRDLYDDTDNIGTKTTILRCEVVRRFGGLYADVDYECLRPFDRFHRIYDFYGTLRVVLSAHLLLPIAPASFVVDCSLFGARPGHPVLDLYLARVRRLWKHKETLELGRWSKLLRERTRERLLTMHTAAQLTGLTFGSVIGRYMDDGAPGGGRTVVLPPSYFNPVDTGWGPARFLSPLYWAGMARHLARGRPRPRHYLAPQPHTFAVHHSEASWL